TSIGDSLDTAGTCRLMTPIGATLTALNTYAGLNDASRANYVVFVTDGIENCNGDGPTATDNLRRHNPQVKTFAIGVGDEAQMAATVLNGIATKGGTARAGAQAYYQANDQDQLIAAFDTIAGSIVTCDYTLDATAEQRDPNRFTVFLGSSTVP